MANQKTKRNYSRKSAKGISDIDTKRILKDLDKPVSVLVGLAAGVPVAMIVEKAVGKQSTVSGLLGIDGTKLTKVLKPAVNLALGLSIHQLAKNQNIKLAGVGLAANGGLIALKDFLGKDILSGFKQAEVAGPENQQQTVKVIEKVIQERPPLPLDLPLLEIEEPDDETRDYIEGMVREIRGPVQPQPVQPTQPDDEPEIILSSDRPEDNYEKEMVEPSEEVEDIDISGDVEIASAPAPVIKPTVPIIVKDVEEDLDFSDIP